VIEPASLIGFGLTLIAAAWLASALLCAGVLLAGRWLRMRGPAAERAAATAALLLGPLLGLMIVAVLAGHSLLWGAVDHCAAHGHHPHLCLVHGTGWTELPWAVMGFAMLATFVASRLVHRIASALHSHRALRRLGRLARSAGEGVMVVPADSWFCFVAGLRWPRIYMSSAAWAGLDAEQRRAVIAHERAHLDAGDLPRGALLALAAVIGAPLLAGRVLAMWRSAAERHCDQRAARVVPATVVAQAMVTMSRSQGAVPAGFAFDPGAELARRVEGLLDGGPSGEPAARRLSVSGAVLAAGTAALLIAFADPLHHLVETLFGVL
jgi:hypothetical protein